MRPGRSMLTASSNPDREPPTSASAGEDVVVSEDVAAFLLRGRAADVVEPVVSAEEEHPASLCESCTFMRETHGRRGQRYLLCRNPSIPAKYLPQPVVSCDGYAPKCHPAREV